MNWSAPAPTRTFATLSIPAFSWRLLARRLAIGRYGALLAFLVLLADLIWKSTSEEALLGQEFGAAFDEHRRHTGFFLPRFS